MSAIGRFHSITMKIKGFGRVWLLFLLYRWDNEEGGMFQYHFRRGKEHETVIKALIEFMFAKVAGA